jgi:predicted nucleic acid-binding protein
LKSVVVDASVALAWCFPDESSDYADRVLVALEGHELVVPAIWGLEITNALLVGERSKRLGPSEIRRFALLLESLPVLNDAQPFTELVNDVLPLARDYGLSAYDAAYLEVAIRYGAELATLDKKLQKAAQSAGVQMFAGRRA